MDIVVSIYWLLILRRHFACAVRGPVAFGDSGYVASHRHEVTGDADQASLRSALILALISAISTSVACPLRSACRVFQSRLLT